MLVLGRKTRQSLTLQTQDGTITIFIKKIKGQYVHVGIDAPRTVNVDRTELLETLDKE